VREEAGAGHKLLRKLTIEHSEVTTEDLDELVRTFIESFPSLSELDLHFSGMNLISFDAIDKLAGLRSHAILSTIVWLNAVYSDLNQLMISCVTCRVPWGRI